MSGAGFEKLGMPKLVSNSFFQPSYQTESSYLFWLDILCIPTRSVPGVDWQKLKKLRETAMGQIPIVFAGAARPGS